jgi:hypothetical protein
MSPDSEPPAFDEDFIKGASFNEPSARERAKPPKPRKLRRPRGPGPWARWKRRRPQRGFDDGGARLKTLLIIGGLVALAVLLAVVVGPSWEIQFRLP